jgi:hypothetical protein
LGHSPPPNLLFFPLFNSTSRLKISMVTTRHLSRRLFSLNRFFRMPRDWFPLGSILWNRFGQNLRAKPYMVTFKFVIMISYGFKMPQNTRLVSIMLGWICICCVTLAKIWGSKNIRKSFLLKWSFVKLVRNGVFVKLIQKGVL